MKHLNLLLLSFCFTLFSLNTHAQWVSIPDTNFGKWLNTNGYSQCLQGNSVAGWQMDTTCPAVVGAKTISCIHKLVKDFTGVQFFDSLTTFICDYNYADTLPPLPPMLSHLRCPDNQLVSLPQLPSTLKVLSCDGNELSSLPAIPSGLTNLSCGVNQLTSLPVLPLGLKSLAFNYNQFTVWPVLPATIQVLFCDNNLLTNIPSLPSGLTQLYCHNNQFVSLPALPSSLVMLYCHLNQLTALPQLPSGLLELDCRFNQITSIPPLPNGLQTLKCSYNQLVTLPSLPNSLLQLYCNNNLLNAIPQLPDSLNNFDCSRNLDLTCLPELKSIISFVFDSTGIDCLPNYPLSNSVSSPPLNTVPICGILNTNNCPYYWNISGELYSDTNLNCIYDLPESTGANIPIVLTSNGIEVGRFITSIDGVYSFGVMNGSYDCDVDTTYLPLFVACPSAGSYTATISNTNLQDTSLNFGLRCKPGFDLKAQSITASVFRPANSTPINITAGDASNFYNAHCAAGTAGSVVLTYTGPVQFVSATTGALTPTVSGNTLTYTIVDFGNVNFFTDFNIVMHTDTSAQIGQQVCFTLTVNPIAGDNNPANNVLTQCFTVVASYDPNDKTAYPAGNIDTAQKELTYTIRFQNTGTAEAQHIYITDTLDTDVDASTFQLLAYSHQPMVQLKENAVRFNFPNINLPDSNTNEPLSHGYVQYKVKLKDNLPIGTVINNTAYIYFDFNAPVVTNTTTNTISLNTGIQAASHEPLAFRMFPNPSNGSVTLSVDESLIGSTAIVSDITGRVVAAVPLTTQYSTLSTLAFGSGVYFVTVGNNTQKLIIHH